MISLAEMETGEFPGGSPDALAGAARSFTSAAHAVGEVAELAHAATVVASGDGWRGAGASAFHGNAKQLSSDLNEVVQALGEAGRASAAYSRELAAAQGAARQAQSLVIAANDTASRAGSEHLAGDVDHAVHTANAAIEHSAILAERAARRAASAFAAVIAKVHTFDRRRHRSEWLPSDSDAQGPKFKSLLAGGGLPRSTPLSTQQAAHIDKQIRELLWNFPPLEFASLSYTEQEKWLDRAARQELVTGLGVALASVPSPEGFPTASAEQALIGEGLPEFGEPEFTPPEIFVDRHGRLTNGVYRLTDLMDSHLLGTFDDQESQFLSKVDAHTAVLDAAAYADANNLWYRNRAKVFVTNGPIGVTGIKGN